MRSEDLFRAIGGVDDELLERSEKKPEKVPFWANRRNWFRVGGAALAACLMIAVVVRVAPGFGPGQSGRTTTTATADGEEKAVEEEMVEEMEELEEGGALQEDVEMNANTAEINKGGIPEEAEGQEEAAEEAAESMDGVVWDGENYRYEDIDLEAEEVQEFEFNGNWYVLMAAYTEVPEEAKLAGTWENDGDEIYMIPGEDSCLWKLHDGWALEYWLRDEE